MRKVTNNWYVVTGGPSVGKTALLNELEKREYKTFPEIARMVIDEGIIKGLTVEQIRRDEKSFQMEVLKRKKDLENQHDKNLLTFFDRGMQDTIAYMRSYGWKLEKKLGEEINKSKYRKIFLLDPLPEFVKDYARTEDEKFINNINKLLEFAYKNSGHEVVKVPAMPIKERADFVLKHVK